MTKLILKVQTSLSTNADTQMVLVYDKDRSVMGEFPITEGIAKVMNGKPKRYFHAEVDDEGCIHLGKPVKEQAW